jgi:hypothetical protein
MFYWQQRHDGDKQEDQEAAAARNSSQPRLTLKASHFPP